MRTLELSGAFKKDFKRIKATPRHKNVRGLFENIVSLLAHDQPLPEYCQDHPLIGDWKGYRECHLKPDLLLIYRKDDPDILKIARLGSHSELFS